MILKGLIYVYNGCELSGPELVEGSALKDRSSNLTVRPA